jgi:hypothetical protein
MTPGEQKLNALAKKYSTDFTKTRQEPRTGATYYHWTAQADGKIYEMSLCHQDNHKRTLDEFVDHIAQHFEMSLQRFRREHPVDGEKWK